MPIAAVPSYLGDDFSTASPGLRFGMYLRLWGEDRRSHEVSWEMHDIDHKVSGQHRQEREVKIENKVSSLNHAKKLNSNDKVIINAFLARQKRAFVASTLDTNGMILDALSTSPFTTGLGNEHPLENGFAFLNPYGLPYLPGSGVKGVLRQAARELTSGEWGESLNWDDDTITALFGPERQDGETNHLRGALTFWDVMPQIKDDHLAVEIMTPHQGHYYQQKQDTKTGGSVTPHDSGQPTPISFLTVPAGAGFTFHVQCNSTLLKATAPNLAQSEKWKILLQAAFGHAFAWLGFGAKTAVGYGALTHNAEAEQARQDAAKARRQAEADQLAAQQRRAALESMTPADRFIAEAIGHKQPDQADDNALFNTLKDAIQNGGLEDNLRHEIAGKLKVLMEEHKSWRERSEKKKPEKDKPYQQTLQVISWLA